VGRCAPQESELRCQKAGGTIGIPLDQVARVETDRASPHPSPPTVTSSRFAPAAHAASPRPTGPLPVAEVAAPLLPGDLTPTVVQARIDHLTRSLGVTVADTASVRRELSLMHGWLGNAAMLANDYQRAEGHYADALQHDPELLSVRVNRGAALIALRRYDAADRLLLEVLPERPGLAEALDLLGESAFQAGRLDEAISHWERAQAARPDPRLESRLEQARRLRDAEDGFHQSGATHFLLKFDGGEATPELAREILAHLEDSYAALASRFAHYPDTLIQVTLYSRQAFHAATDSPQWVGGLFDGQIRIPVRGLTHLTPHVKRVLVHELAHSFIHSKTQGNAPPWIQEGVAQVVEGKSAAADRESLASERRAAGGSEHGLAFGYTASLSQVEFLISSWSESHLNALLDHLGRGADIDAALKAVTGHPQREFLRAWEEWLER